MPLTPHLGGLLLALREPPQHENAWRIGEVGEETVAAFLEQRMAGGAAILLHDRRMPRRHGNIDHLAIAPSGVFVIDAKAWKGKVRVAKPLRGAAKLLIAGRDRTKLIDGLERQLAAVRGSLIGRHADVPIRGALCFTRAELPMLGTLTIRGHLVVSRKMLAKRISAPGPLTPVAIADLAGALADSFPPA